VKTIPWDGEPISKPGIYSGIDLDIYHSVGICDSPSISSSGLRTIFNESPAHFFAKWRGNPDAVDRTDARHFIVGRAVHHLLLGEPFFAKIFAIQPEEYEGDAGEIKKWNNNATDCKLWHKKMREAGRSVLTGKEVEDIKGMARSLGMHPLIRAGALNGQIERSIFWKDKKTGIWLKSRPDTIPGDSGDFVDLKTCQSVQWGDLVRAIGDYGYHQQGGLIRRGAREALGIENATFSLVFIEKQPPYCARVVTLKDNDLDRGEKQNTLALDIFAQSLKTKHWPGPGGDREDAEPIELSEFEHKRIDADLIIKGA
jgi:hypothetical protein